MALDEMVAGKDVRICDWITRVGWIFTSSREFEMKPSGVGRYQFLGAITAGWMMAASPITPAFADSLWDHNGSVMRLSERGNQIEIFYEVPRAGMVQQGVRRGQLFFNGQRHGSKVVGIARAFLRRCPAPMEYAIQGDMVTNSTIVLKGRRPEFKDCRPQKTLKNDELIFVFLSGGVDSDAATSSKETPQIPDSLEPSSGSDTGLAWIDQLLQLHQPRQ
jgi:hypothetical protein